MKVDSESRDAPEVSADQVAAFRLARHHLATPAPKASMARVAGDMCGAQAQIMSAGALSLRARVRGVRVRTEVPEQPFGDEALQGAMNRAKAAIGTGDFGVGIEAGLVWSPLISDYFDVQDAAIVDRAGHITVGHGPGFTYPPRVLENVKAGRSVGKAMARLTGIRDIGSKEGAIGYLTERRLDRDALTESAVLMAMVPRIRRELYTRGAPHR